MRLLYSFFWLFALPVALCRLWWRGRNEPGYRQYISERLGIVRNTLSNGPVIWVHAVSVGETRAAEPLIRALLHHFPGHRILLSHMTPTGRATGTALFQSELNHRTVQQCYLPYDLEILIAGLLRTFKPQLCILMETEVWPNLIARCVRQKVPVALLNARLSPRSLRKAQRFSALFGPAASSLSLVAAQTEADAARIRTLGAGYVTVTGNTKFDVKVSAAQIETGQQLRQQWGARQVLLCASTREGEEILILAAFRALVRRDFLLLIVPRHPQRFDLVAQLIIDQGLNMVRKTALSGATMPDTVDVVLGDTMGEMTSYYFSCDLAFIGGSLLPLGGQNLIEACAVGKPVLLGPHTFNFSAVSSDALAAGAALCVDDATQLFQTTEALFADQVRRAGMAQHAMAFAAQHRGATERTLDLLRDFLNSATH